jgi:hypothetical protein
VTIRFFKLTVSGYEIAYFDGGQKVEISVILWIIRVRSFSVNPAKDWFGNGYKKPHP